MKEALDRKQEDGLGPDFMVDGSDTDNDLKDEEYHVRDRLKFFCSLIHSAFHRAFFVWLMYLLFCSLRDKEGITWAKIKQT